MASLSRHWYLFLFVCQAAGQCPSYEWTETDTHCYIIVFSHLSFHEASDHCRDLGAHLASIHSQEELTLISALSARKVDNNVWIGLVNTSGKYEWTDGTEVTSWTSAHVQKIGDSKCAAMAADKMVTRPCEYFYYFACKTLVDVETTSSTTTSTTTTTTTVTSTTVATTTLKTTSLSTTVPTTRALLERITARPEIRSIVDTRPSAVGIGSVAVTILVVILVVIFLLDIVTFVKHFRWMRSNIKQAWRRWHKKRSKTWPAEELAKITE